MRTRDELAKRGCVGKVAHRNRAAAHLAAEVARRDQGETISPYRCPWCGSWHIGHPPSLETLREIAHAMRHDPPKPHQPKEQKQ